jgi:hypothetical protein
MPQGKMPISKCVGELGRITRGHGVMASNPLTPDKSTFGDKNELMLTHARPWPIFKVGSYHFRKLLAMFYLQHAAPRKCLPAESFFRTMEYQSEPEGHCGCDGQG